MNTKFNTIHLGIQNAVFNLFYILFYNFPKLEIIIVIILEAIILTGSLEAEFRRTRLKSCKGALGSQPRRPIIEHGAKLDFFGGPGEKLL